MKCSLFATLGALLCCSTLPAQISPGPLSRAHEQLEGVSQCKTCHDFGAGRRSFKCLECHTEIQSRLAAHSGYHTRAYQSSASQADCARCHMEHNGQRFALVKFDHKSFDHQAQTGFALEGKHRALECEKCHMEKNIAPTERARVKVKDLNHTYLALQRECTSCHEDAHRGQEGTDCKRCHQQDSWRAATGFNHASTAFPLTGLHHTVRCEKCHTRSSAEKTALFKGVSFSSCQSCHMDPHKGAFREAKFQGSCETCHSTAGWKNGHPSSGFDHSRTKFALVGKHAGLACSRCHKDSDFHNAIAHGRCSDCHEDPHKGQFVSRAAGSDCSACHNQLSYKPTLFDREAHRKSAFPLEGKHAPLNCEGCHKPAGRDAVYILKKLICSDCHADPHNGQFVAVYSNKCNLCHEQTGFQPSTFTVARHAQTRFVLTGKHVSVACGDCHKSISGTVSPMPVAASLRVPTTPPRQYHFASQTCKICHDDPHQTLLACESCHTADAWKTTLNFDHSTTTFPLDGAHVKVSCAQCHAGTPAKFAKTASQCSACHAEKDVHGGQFRSGLDEDCSSCHVTLQWKHSVFNHDRARFALDIAHRNVRCEKCHEEKKDLFGKTIRVYRGTPMECVSCHRT